MVCAPSVAKSGISRTPTCAAPRGRWDAPRPALRRLHVTMPPALHCAAPTSARRSQCHQPHRQGRPRAAWPTGRPPICAARAPEPGVAAPPAARRAAASDALTQRERDERASGRREMVCGWESRVGEGERDNSDKVREDGLPLTTLSQ
jgi:hypothetical protein